MKKIPEVYLMPARALVGKIVKRPKGKREYTCTLRPDSLNITRDSVTPDEYSFGSIVYLNSDNYSNAWAAHQKLKCRLTKDEIIKIKQEFNLSDDYKMQYLTLSGPKTIEIGDLIY